MKYTNLLCFFLFATLTSTCNEMKDHQPEKQIIVENTSYQISDDVEPPPPNLTYNFKNIDEWLSNICDAEKPKKLITNYDIGLFESTGNNTIYMVGINKYRKGDTSYIKNEFESPNMYFRLPLEDYKELSKGELLKKLSIQLKNFTTTEKFRSSFLSEAITITFNPDGQIIWSK